MHSEPSQTISLWPQEQPPEVFCKKGVHENFAKFTGKHQCQSLFLIKLDAKASNFIKKETLTQLFSSEFCEIFRTTPVAAPVTTEAVVQGCSKK